MISRRFREPFYYDNATTSFMEPFIGDEFLGDLTSDVPTSGYYGNPWNRWGSDMDRLMRLHPWSTPTSSFTPPFPTNLNSMAVPSLVDERLQGKMKEWVPRADVSETDQEFRIRAELPGMEKKDVHVEIDDKQMLLTLRGETKQQQKEEKENFIRVERRIGNFRRSFRMPNNARLDAVKAQMNQGILNIIVPKTGAKEMETKKINVQ